MPDTQAIAIVFPGQGAQKPGMAKDFHDASAAARLVFAEASDALSLDAARLCFDEEEKLGLTEFAQPAILVAEIAMLAALRESHGLSAVAWGGHSLGEYTALVAAGVRGVGEASALVRERGRVMQEAAPLGSGAMLAVIARDLDAGALMPALAGLRVDVANLNSTDQVVLSGTVADLETARARLKDLDGFDRAKCIPLRVSAPFHSRLMRPAADRFRPLLTRASASWNPTPAGTVASNYTGAMHAEDTASIVDALVKQIDAPVRWLDNMRTLLDRCDRVIELGPGRPLRGFFGSLGVKIDCITDLESAATVLGTP
jgi:[acyl-carrier-protein] S-malonyltransferase/trans-AT polyketide synthase/acyltransferase/oxidoreductase domain-containing protein